MCYPEVVEAEAAMKPAALASLPVKPVTKQRYLPKPQILHLLTKASSYNSTAGNMTEKVDKQIAMAGGKQKRPDFCNKPQNACDHTDIGATQSLNNAHISQTGLVRCRRIWEIWKEVLRLCYGSVMK